MGENDVSIILMDEILKKKIKNKSSNLDEDLDKIFRSQPNLVILKPLYGPFSVTAQISYIYLQDKI